MYGGIGEVGIEGYGVAVDAAFDASSQLSGVDEYGPSLVSDGAFAPLPCL